MLFAFLFPCGTLFAYMSTTHEPFSTGASRRRAGDNRLNCSARLRPSRRSIECSAEFYARFGYQECGRTPAYPRGHDDIHLVKRLR